MAASSLFSSKVLWELGVTWCITQFHYAASGDTVAVPVGCQSAQVLVASGTAPTAAVTAGATTDSVALTGGTTGVTLFLVSRHAGNPAASR